MPKFTGQLGEPDARAASGVQRGVVDRSGAIGLNNLASSIQAIGAEVAASNAKETALEAGRQFGEATNDLSGLQDERANLILRQEELDRTRSNINTEDGITEQEQAQLDSIQGEVDLLTEARRTGVLNDNVFGIRKRALQTSAMARVDNLGIQAQISGIFSAGRGSIAVQADPQQQAITDSLDAQYGKDNWTEDQRGAYLSRKQHITSMSTMGAQQVVEARDQVAIGVTNLVTEELTTLMNTTVGRVDPNTGLKTPTGFFTEQDRAGYTLAVTGKINQMRLAAQEKFAEAKAQGHIIPQEDIDDVFQRIDAAEDNLTVKAFDEGFLKGRSHAEFLENYNKISEQATIAQYGLSPETLAKLGLEEAGNLQTLINQLGNDKFIAANAALLGMKSTEVRTQLQQHIANIQAGIGLTNRTIPPEVTRGIQLALSVNQSLPKHEDTKAIHMTNYSEGSVVSNDIGNKDLNDHIKASVAASQNILRSKNKSPQDVRDVATAMSQNTHSLIRRFEEIGGRVFIRDGQLITDDGKSDTQDIAAQGSPRARAAASTASFEARAIRTALVSQFQYNQTLEAAGHLSNSTLFEVETTPQRQAENELQAAVEAEGVRPDVIEPIDEAVLDAEPIPNDQVFKSGAFRGGDDAVAAVEAREGPLSLIERRVVELEGFVGAPYLDTKGVKTFGVGQTGEFINKSFKESLKVKEQETRRLVSGYDGFSDEVKAELVQANYRGDLKGSPKFLKLLNTGDLKAAAREFLDNKEFRDPKTPDHIKDRIFDVALALRNEG